MGNGHTCKNCRGVLYTYKNAIFPFKTNLYLSNSHNGVRITLRCIDVFYKKVCKPGNISGELWNVWLTAFVVLQTFHISPEILPGLHTFTQHIYATQCYSYSTMWIIKVWIGFEGKNGTFICLKNSPEILTSVPISHSAIR